MLVQLQSYFRALFSILTLDLLASLIVGLIGGLLAPILWRRVLSFWSRIREMYPEYIHPYTGYIIGILMAIGLVGSTLLDESLGTVLVRSFIAIVTFGSWWGFRRLESINEQQLRILRNIQMSGATPDGGRIDDPENEKSGSSRIGGSIAGGLAGGILGSAFGPGGAAAGAIIGAALGDEWAKSQIRKENQDLTCAIVRTLVNRQAWHEPINADYAIQYASLPGEEDRARKVWDALDGESFIQNMGERGYKLDPSHMEDLAGFLMNSCGWGEWEIRSRLHHFDDYL